MSQSDLVPPPDLAPPPAHLRVPRALRHVLSAEVLTFLAVGGTGYVVDLAAFNVLRSLPPYSTLDPSVARTLALLAAMCVTYLGNRTLTWRHQASQRRRREVSLFVLFNVIGLGFSVATLTISHDLLDMTSRLADNISANVIGLALGTAFRYATYKRFVFTGPVPGEVAGPRPEPPQPAGTNPSVRSPSMR